MKRQGTIPKTDCAASAGRAFVANALRRVAMLRSFGASVRALHLND